MVIHVINFIVCEDEKILREKTKGIIDSLMMNYDIDYKINEFDGYDSNFENLVKEDIGFKIYLLDIKTKYMSGIDAARMIREKYDDWNSVIILITSYSEYKYEALCSRLFLLDYINKLDNGLFEVRIPITNSFVGKNLVVYYVTDDNKIEEHEVTVKDGYAIFKTNHFSIYTLAEKNDTVVPSDTNSTIESPKTFDSISIWAGVLLISILGVTGSAIYLNKYKKNF